MKISRILLRDFKRFETIEIQVTNGLTQAIADQFLILGDNGTGKTTILQAVALCLTMASHRIEKMEEFDWVGWLPARYYRWGTPYIELDVHFTQPEINATRQAARRWHEILHPHDEFREPGDTPDVTVSLEGTRYSAKGGINEIYQFGGRAYAASVLKQDPSVRDLFRDLPGCFWFDQFRNLASPPPENAENSKAEEATGRVSYAVGVARLREHLNRWKLARITTGARLGGRLDFLLELENLYKRVFPGRSFSDPEPMYRDGVPTPADYYFMISDGHRTYDLEEMSAGEQSIFPLLYEFVRQQIRNSVVLIDEVDLNLHPPLAQALLSALPSMGPGCQFFLTTHSEAISSLVSPNQVYRLEGGRLCL
jgi:Cdc6-like AAA superfamily ATPase